MQVNIPYIEHVALVTNCRAFILGNREEANMESLIFLLGDCPDRGMNHEIMVQTRVLIIVQKTGE